MTPVLGGVAVNSSLEITHHVRVQPIVTKKADGTTTTFLGGASIESYIDRVYPDFRPSTSLPSQDLDQNVTPSALINCRSCR